MTDTAAVNVFNATDNLLEKLARLCLFEFLTLDDMIEQLPSARVLHDQEQLPRSFDNLKDIIAPLEMYLGRKTDSQTVIIFVIIDLPRKVESHSGA